MAVHKVIVLLVFGISIRFSTAYDILYGGNILTGLHHNLNGGYGRDLNFDNSAILASFDHNTRRISPENEFANICEDRRAVPTKMIGLGEKYRFRRLRMLPKYRRMYLLKFL